MITLKKKLITLLIVIMLLTCNVCPSFADENDSSNLPLPGTPALTVTAVPDGVRITWTESQYANGYYIYYRTNPDSGWIKLTTKDSPTTLRIVRKPNVSNATYYYQVKAYNDTGTSPASNEASLYWIAPPEITSCTASGQFLTTAWESQDNASGYQLQYSSNRFFTDAATIDIKDPGVTSRVIKGLSSKKKYYVRIRAYEVTDTGKKYYSPWTHSDNCYATKKATVSVLKYKGKTLELRKLAKQSVGSYDTLQGGCRSGNYGFYVMYNRKVEKCKIIKVNLTTGKVVKRSGVLKISHGNDLTYNPNKKVLVAVHSTQNAKKVSEINPTTLRIIRTRIINLNKPLPGMSEARRASYTGIGAIAYNSTYRQYVVRIKPLNDLLYLDENFNPVRYVRLIERDSQLYQGMDTAGNYILIGQSFKDGKPYNIISVYDWNGNYLSKVNIKKGYELENIYHYGNTFHAAFYTSYYETYYVKGYKIKKVRGKKVKVKTKLKRKRLKRVNYIYKLSNL